MINNLSIQTKFTVILADNNRDYLRMVSDYLTETGRFTVSDYAFDGREAVELMLRHKPDLFIVDLIMPVLDGFAVLEELMRAGYNAGTRIVMTSAVALDFILKKAEGFSVDYIFLKPFDKDVFKKRILELMEFRSEAPRVSHAADPAEIITQHIKKVGITANVKGYYYLRDAILLVHNDFDLMSHLTTGLYASVAEKYNSTPQRVERAMRHAIESAWNRGDIRVLEDFFGYTIHDDKGKPTNGEFIAMLADKLNTELKYVD
jgi:two-component system response regulator (stage 0 sporulation protein A)